VPEGDTYLYHGQRRIAYQTFVAPPEALSQPPSEVALPVAPVVRKSTAAHGDGSLARANQLSQRALRAKLPRTAAAAAVAYGSSRMSAPAPVREEASMGQQATETEKRASRRTGPARLPLG